MFIINKETQLNMINTLEQALKEIQDLKDKLNKYENQNKNFKSFLNKYKINNEKELKDFIIKYYEHECLSVENTQKYKQLKGMYEDTFRKLNTKENSINIEKERLKIELESLKKKNLDKEQELEDIIREEKEREYKDQLDMLKDANDNIRINSNEKIEKLTYLLEDINKQHSEELEKIKSEYEKQINKNVKKEISLPTPSNSDKVENVKVHKNVDLLNEIPIIIYEKTEDECCKYVAGEFCNKIKYKYNLKEMLNDNKSTMKKVVDYISTNEEKLNQIRTYKNKQNKWNIETKINRCHYLYKIYGENLNKVKFRLSSVCRIGEDRWNLWLKQLDKILKVHKNVDLENNKENSSVEELQKDIKIDESRKYIPRKLFKNETKITNTSEWYKHVDYSQYKVGDTVIADKKGFVKKVIIIGNYCKKCRNPFNDKGDICYSCDKEEYNFKNGLLGSCVPAPIESDYNKCNNCCNLFKYNDINDEYCNDCIINNN